MESIEQHRLLVSDEVCQSRYRQAILQTVKAGDIVLDLGAGTGIHSLFCCQAGAAKVYAIEQGDVIELAKRISLANNTHEKLVFIRGLSSRVELPEKVDLIVTHIGFRNVLSSLINARARFLKEDGKIIPAAMEFFCVPLEWPSLYDEAIGFWEQKHFGIDFAPMRAAAVNEDVSRNFTPNNFLAEPQSMARIELKKFKETHMSGSGSFTFSKPGTVHGLGVWFTLWLTDEISFTSAPPLALASPPWSHSFFPIERPMEVKKGDVINVSMNAKAFTPQFFLWKWRVEGDGIDGRPVFDHSTFNKLPLSPEMLRKQNPAYKPSVNSLGQAACAVLDLCDGLTPLNEIERRVFDSNKSLFSTEQDAAAFVAGILKKYAK